MCRICKDPRILNLVETALENNISYREISKKIYQQFNRMISYGAVARHVKYCKRNEPIPSIYSNYELYWKISKIKKSI